MHRRVQRLLSAGALIGMLGPSLSAGRQSPYSPAERSIDELQRAMRAQQISCRTLVQYYLQRIDAYDKRGPALNAVQTINARALEEADRLDTAFRTSGPAGPLHCVPVLVKDQFDTAGLVTTYGSAAFRGFVPERDATAVAKLRAAGALIIGKATMGEFASGYAGSVSGPIHNPYDPRRHPSGSSGGTGASIAADYATVGLAEDTGGSVRAPAAATSLVGHRPTTPLVSRYGMLPARPSTDSVGPIARNVRDAAILLDVIAGFDARDPFTAYAVGNVPRSFAANLDRNALNGARLGVIRKPLHPQTNTAAEDYRAIHAVFERAIGELTSAGAEAVDVNVELRDLPERLGRSYDDNVYETEAAIDGFLAQHPAAPVRTLRELLMSGKGLLPWRAKGLSNSVGKATTDAGYLQVLLRIEEVRRMVLAAMAAQRLDALVYPTADHHPGFIAADIMTNPDVSGDTRLGSNRILASILGFPATTVPAGFTSDGVPVGLEFMARPYRDATTLGYAYAYEQATHHRRPPSTTPSLVGQP